MSVRDRRRADAVMPGSAASARIAYTRHLASPCAGAFFDETPTGNQMIDLRSDTVTRPSAPMLAAMTAAEVGDDVWGDDPTVQRLQAAVAERAGKEAGLFCPSGTQSNLVALMTHCGRGDEYIVGQAAHTYRYEGGGAAVLGSIQPQPIENAADGTLPLDKIAAAIKPLDDHFARTRVLALENTIGGKVLPAGYVEEAAALARRHGLATHLDGARVCNAAVASGRSLAEHCAPFDTVSICFSKGLGAPVGSVLVGSRELIAQARRWRKMLGGGMRQAGLLAAACLYALEHNVERLADDHANAGHLAQGLARIGEIKVLSQATNMVFAQLPEADCAPLETWLKARGILTQMLYSTRFVTHLDVSRDDIDTVVDAISAYFARSRA
ncbi:Low-specificity L-threonine aldolase [Burkholderia singularis]|uniref:Low-specificity L-threonine aldolase n=2 Tax=Burkholderia singularis TaxID=1503053 RepID=A0A238HB68_9BURK|nr:Low-specificity L-threonine aldolase [Burkholderia singularis]